MSSEIGNHFVEAPESSCRQVDRIALFAAIIVRAPFSEVATLAGVQYECSWLQRCGFLPGVHRAGYLQPREKV